MRTGSDVLAAVEATESLDEAVANILDHSPAPAPDDGHHSLPAASQPEEDLPAASHSVDSPMANVWDNPWPTCGIVSNGVLAASIVVAGSAEAQVAERPVADVEGSAGAEAVERPAAAEVAAPPDAEPALAAAEARGSIFGSLAPRGAKRRDLLAEARRLLQ